MHVELVTGLLATNELTPSMAVALLIYYQETNVLITLTSTEKNSGDAQSDLKGDKF